MKVTRADDRFVSKSPLNGIGLAGAVAHEVRRLLTPARAYAELALRQPGLSADVSRSLSATIAAAVAVDEALDRLTAIHGDAGECDPADVISTLQGAGTFRSFVAANCRVRVAAAALEMILANLVSNAVRANGGDGSVDIRVSKSATGNTPEVLVEVEDQGTGMTDEQVQRSVIPFVSHSASTGLGLAICRHLIETAGGNLQILSVPGSGTRVIVRLPAAQPELRQSA